MKIRNSYQVKMAFKKEIEINKRSPSNKRVALRKKAKIDNRRGYYYSIGKSNKVNSLSLMMSEFH